MFNRNWFYAALGAISAILFVVLMPLTFSFVDYNAYGLKQTSVTGKVDLTTVYDSGRYGWGVGYNALLFPRSYVNVQHNQIKLFTKNGVEVVADVALYYHIEQNNVPLLYSKFGMDYHNQVVVISLAKIKNTAPTFTLQEYFFNRTEIGKVMTTEVAGAMKDIHITLSPGMLQLRQIYLPPNVLAKATSSFVQSQLNLQSASAAIAIAIRQETKRLVTALDAEVLVINGSTQATVDRIISDANAQASTKTLTAVGTATAAMFTAMGINDAPSKSKLMSYQAIIDQGNAKITIGLPAGSIVGI